MLRRPEQVAGYLRRVGEMQISHEMITGTSGGICRADSMKAAAPCKGTAAAAYAPSSRLPSKTAFQEQKLEVLRT